MLKCKDELVIRIRDNGDIVVEDTENGVTGYKQVTPDTLVECIQNSVSIGAVSSGVLPAGAFSFSAKEQWKTVSIEFPSRYCDIVYEKTEYKNFPLPRLVFGFWLKDDRIQAVRLGVVEEGMLTPRTKMFVYPFSNVSGFRLCCGGNRLPNIKSLHQLTGTMYYIMSMPNNNDHYRPGNTKLDLEYRDLLEHLKDKEPDYYYENVLVESDKTLQDFINA